jgi:HSP20 family protein
MNAVTKTQEQGPAARTAAYISPEVNIYETKDAYTLEAEMPGVNKEGIEITLEGNELTLTGHKTVEEPKAECLYHESRMADYRRVFELDPTIDTGKITASMEQGILKLELPKAEKVKPRKISIGE